MSGSICISPQAAKVLASESRSTGSDASVIQMRVKKSYGRKPSFYSSYNSKIVPIRCMYNGRGDDPVIINIIHDKGGAKAPTLIFEEINGGP